MVRSWKIASAYTVGQGHIKKNIPCQDRTYNLAHKQANGVFYGISLGDGAGSCKYSDIGAEYITRKILYFVKSKFLYIFNSNNPRIYILNYIENVLRRLSIEKNIDFKELSSTLLFVAIKNNKYIIGHIGDGAIGMLTKEEQLLTISHPENGEFSNSTFFTTSVGYRERLRVTKGTLHNSLGFILMSDGSCESLYCKRKKKLVDINKNIINWLNNNTEQAVKKSLVSNLENIIAKRTFDDCSIGIIRLYRKKI